MTNIITKTERNYILDSMKSLLTEYDYTFRDDALNRIIDKWATEKEELIAAFKRHPNYLKGKFMIAFNVDYERNIDAVAIDRFRTWLLGYVIETHEYKAKLPTTIREKMARYQFLPDCLYKFLYRARNYSERTISDSIALHLAEIIPEIRVHKGEKTSRVMNRICTYLGYNKHPDYNREFAKFADALSPMTIKRHTILSVNPLDYLTMSFGNSWASCHTIDKTNRREMPNSYHGEYSSGTMSYMLDSTSMVLYTVDASYDGNDFWAQPKINRQMFHWGEQKLIQSRLYPQGNDGDNSAYEPYRKIVQEIMATIFDFPNLWTIKREPCKVSPFVLSRGTHYQDYNCFDSCTISRIKGNINEKKMIIGAEPICIECGSYHANSSNINHCVDKPHRCEHCGRHLSEAEIVDVDGTYMCSDCASERADATTTTATASVTITTNANGIYVPISTIEDLTF